MKPVVAGPLTVPTSASGYVSADLVVNSTETATPTPTIIKTKHFKMSVDTYVSTPANIALGPIVAYIMYVPQGYTLATNTPVDHPEWVLSWRSIDTGSALAGTTYHANVTMSSSLSRNLNSGDAIKFVMVANNVNTANTYSLNAVVHFSCVVRNN